MEVNNKSSAYRLCEPLRHLDNAPPMDWFTLSKYEVERAVAKGYLALPLTPENGHGFDHERSRPFTTVSAIYDEDDELKAAHDEPQPTKRRRNVNGLLFQMVKISEHLKRRGHSTRGWSNIKIRLRDWTLRSAPLTVYIQAKVQLFQLDIVEEMTRSDPLDPSDRRGMMAYLHKRMGPLKSGKQRAEAVLRLGVKEKPAAELAARKLVVRAAEESITRRNLNAGRLQKAAPADFSPPSPSISPQDLPPRHPEDNTFARSLDNIYREAEETAAASGMTVLELIRQAGVLYSNFSDHINANYNEMEVQAALYQVAEAMCRALARLVGPFDDSSDILSTREPERPYQASAEDAEDDGN